MSWLQCGKTKGCTDSFRSHTTLDCAKLYLLINLRILILFYKIMDIFSLQVWKIQAILDQCAKIFIFQNKIRFEHTKYSTSAVKHSSI